MNFLSNLLGVFGSGFNSLFGLVTSTMQKGYQAAIQFHKEGVAFARETGLSAKQAQAYTETLIQRTQVLANKYGVSAEAIAQVQRGLSEATGKQLMLNDAQAEGFVQINKLVGAQNASKFTEEIMNGMGGQIDTVQGAISKVYATAAKQGLNAKKLTDKVAQNLGMANRLSFRNGINGLTRMAALSEKLGINMASVESAAGQFMDLDKAIENAAQMQMLGGSAAANFGNPLTAAYEANYDPEAFAKRMSDSLGSYATFDAKTGMSNINGMNMDFVRNIAKAMGISVEEASKMAKKQAEVKYKENQFGSTLDRYGLNEDQKNFLINNSQVKNGELVYTDTKGVEHNVNQEGVSAELIDEMQRIANMSDKDIMLDQASHLKSIDEQITGAQSKVAASFAEGLQRHIDGIRDKIEGLGDFFSEYAKVWGADTGKVVGEAMAWINQNGETIRNVASGILNGVNKVFDFFSKHWQGLLIAIASWKLIGKPLLSGPGGLGARAATSIGSKLKSLGGKMYKDSPMDIYKKVYKFNRDPSGYGMGKFASFKDAASHAWHHSSKLAKGTAILGAVGAVSQGAMAQLDYNKNVEAINRGEWDRSKYSTKEEALVGAKTERNEGVGGAVGMGLGTTLGTILGGPIGGMIGGAIGEYAGKFIGKNWEKITSFITKGWEKVTRWFTSVNWAKVGETLITIFMPPVRGIIEVVKHWDDISAWVGEKWDGAMAAFGKLWQGIKETWNTYVVDPFKEYVIQPIKNVVKWADENILQPVKGFVEKIKVGFERIMQGIQKFLDDPLGTIKQGASNAYEKGKDWVKDKANKVKEFFGFDEGGIIGGNSYSGDKLIGAFNSGEMVVPMKEQGYLYDFIKKSLPQVVNNMNTTNASTNDKFISSSLLKQITNNGGVSTYSINNNANTQNRTISRITPTSTIYGDTVNKTNTSNSNFTSMSPTSIVYGDSISNKANTSNTNLTNMMPSSVVYGDTVNKPNTSNTSITSMMPSSVAYGDSINNRANTQNHTITSMMPSSTVYGDTTNSYMNSVTSVMPKTAEVKSKPIVGEKPEYIYKPNGSETSTINGNTITVKDFNINLSGTLKLDAGNMSKNIDMNALLNDYQFINGLKAILEEQINRDMNNGRWMNDDAVRRGQTHSLSIIG